MSEPDSSTPTADVVTLLGAVERGRVLTRRICVGLVLLTAIAVSLALSSGEAVLPRAIRSVLSLALASAIYVGHRWAALLAAVLCGVTAPLCAFYAFRLLMVDSWFAVCLSLAMFGLAFGLSVASYLLAFSSDVAAFMRHQRPNVRAPAPRELSSPQAPENDARSPRRAWFADARERARASIETRLTQTRRQRLLPFAAGGAALSGIALWIAAPIVGSVAAFTPTNLLPAAALLVSLLLSLRGNTYGRFTLLGIVACLLFGALRHPSTESAYVPWLSAFLTLDSLALALSLLLLLLALDHSRQAQPAMHRRLRAGLGLMIGVATVAIGGRPAFLLCRPSRFINRECSAFSKDVCQNTPGCAPVPAACRVRCEFALTQNLCASPCRWSVAGCQPPECESVNRLCLPHAACGWFNDRCVRTCELATTRASCRNSPGDCMFSECEGVPTQSCEAHTYAQCPIQGACEQRAE